MPMNAEVGKVQMGVTHMTQDEKYEKGEEENKEKSKNLE